MKRALSLAVLLAFAGDAQAKSKAKTPPPPPVEVTPPAPPPDPEAWRAQQPAPEPEKAWSPPAARSFTLSNGIPVYFVANEGLPLASVRLVVKVGREANPAGKAGLGALAANMLDEGTKTRTGAQIAAEAQALGAELSVGGGDELAWVALDALTGEPLAKSLDLMADVALAPKFDAKDFARVKAETLTGIQSARAEPRDVAARVFLAQLWGASHPYGVPSVGTEASVAGLKAGDVKKFYGAHWHAGNAAFVVAGAVDEATLKPLLEARFGGWKAGKATRAEVLAPSVPAKTRVVFVEQPGAVQSVLRVGTAGPKRTAPEFQPANVAGTIVGGMFWSRLNMNLREEHGWSYGAYGGFSESRDFGTFAVRTSVQADKTAPAVAEVLKELAAAAQTAPSDEILKRAKDGLTKSLAGNFETNAATAYSFLAIPGFGLPNDLWSGWLAELEKVDANAVAAQAKRSFDTNRMLVVVVGPRTIEAGGQKVDVVAELKALGHEFVEVPAP
ncbi:MAG: M16 family metallopeptidase [Myxococcota bacterium]